MMQRTNFLNLILILFLYNKGVTYAKKQLLPLCGGSIKEIYKN